MAAGSHGAADSAALRGQQARRVRRIRLAMIGGGAAGGALGAVQVHQTFGALLPWWALGPLLVGATVLGGALGACYGREARIRKDSLEPTETVLWSFPVRPAPPPPRRPALTPDPDTCDLRATTRHLQLWQGAELLWSHPYAALALDPRPTALLVHHQGALIGELVWTSPTGMPEEVRLGLARLARRGVSPSAPKSGTTPVPMPPPSSAPNRA
ncbi:hypothetical protein [Streptomyces sp. NPDC090025]|uniref:hypothetical protein n=1 Tax=Streptomyces sp. NPDC090025 TaxID=3365922 RepID=UPI0038372F6E